MRPSVRSVSVSRRDSRTNAVARLMNDGVASVLESFSIIRSQETKLPEGLLPILLIILFVIIYVIARVYQYSRRSDQQWREVDRSKLRQWNDEDD